MKIINTTNAKGNAVVLQVTGKLKKMPLSGLMAYPVKVLSADGPYYCTGWYLAGGDQ